MPHRIVFGVSGATGMRLAQAVLEAFATVPELEVHLIVSESAGRVLAAECATDVLAAPAARRHDPADIAAGPASGSWTHDGMIVCPCSMSTLASIANGCGSNLIHRAADVTLKEGRRLVLTPRETPLSRIHLKNMLAAQEAGAVIRPFMPSFHGGGRELALDGMMLSFAGRLLDQFRISHELAPRWRDNN